MMSLYCPISASALNKARTRLPTPNLARMHISSTARHWRLHLGPSREHHRIPLEMVSLHPLPKHPPHDTSFVNGRTLTLTLTINLDPPVNVNRHLPLNSCSPPTPVQSAILHRQTRHSRHAAMLCAENVCSVRWPPRSIGRERWGWVLGTLLPTFLLLVSILIIPLDNVPPLCRCPVCRATLPGWDGRGGGVIGLKARVVISL